MTKSINSVDQSLDEALFQIGRLKEDMTHLCKDIDSLYNSKVSEQELNEFLAKYDSEALNINNTYSSDSTVPFEVTQTTNKNFNRSSLNKNGEIIEEFEMVRNRKC